MATMKFKRGDAVTHYFLMPASSWSAGGTLFFSAKASVDDDTSDTAAVISTSYSDSVVTDETVSGTTYKKYTCLFPASATNSISMGSEKKKKYLGEFQWVSSGGVPSTFPGEDDFLDVIVYADIKRATA